MIVAMPITEHDSAVRPPEAERLVHFAGAWTDEERCLISRVVAESEATTDRPPVPPVMGKPWVCTRQALAGRSLYMAHRLKWHRKVLTARTAEELAERIARP